MTMGRLSVAVFPALRCAALRTGYALEARRIPHLLVGGRSFYLRAEVESLRTALAAAEWPTTS